LLRRSLFLLHEALRVPWSGMVQAHRVRAIEDLSLLPELSLPPRPVPGTEPLEGGASRLQAPRPQATVRPLPDSHAVGGIGRFSRLRRSGLHGSGGGLDLPSRAALCALDRTCSCFHPRFPRFEGAASLVNSAKRTSAVTAGAGLTMRT